ncbi:MAG: AAA-like domain-containing protein [Cyanobacteria bacterium J06642_11]
MSKWFNTAGPCRPDKNYMLPAIERLPPLDRLIAQESYFVVHAPRQTGKTTAMLALAQQLTAQGEYAAIMVSAEVGQPFSHNPDKAETYILESWRQAARAWLPPELQPPPWPQVEGSKIGAALQAWCQACPKPLVIFIDEIDSLTDDALISVLRQLRDGYPRRPENFPHSLALIGMRDVRDYKITSGGRTRLQTASPFNIKVRSFTLPDFTQADVSQLYQQHTDATGQLFTPEAIATAFELTQGQPWLVNALAKEIVEEIIPDEQTTITPDHVHQAKEILIRRRETHLDSLSDRLEETRIRAVMEPLMAGQELDQIPIDDRDYLVDLGLLRRSSAGGVVVANRIYQEVLPRMLASGPQDSLPQISPTWLKSDGELDVEKLLEAFLAFWRQHGQPLLKSAPYHEIAPHLVMMAFLHRVVNGGGTLEREYAIGTDRMDLCLRYGAVTLGIELKVWRQGRPDPLGAGLVQLDKYLAGLGLGFGWLVIFDQREEQPPIAERVTTQQVDSPSGRKIIVIYC